jgi:hypothetical protein
MLKKPFVIFVVVFFNSKMPCKNSNLAQELFLQEIILEDLILYIIKGYQKLNLIEMCG